MKKVFIPTASREDTELIHHIVDRAKEFDPEIEHDPLSAIMDITACHMKTPLALKLLLRATVIDFMHDVTGILRHINRENGELTEGFIPRYARVYHQRKSDWVKRLGQWHLSFDGEYETICGSPMLGNNYAKVIPEKEREKCPKCHGLGEEKL